MLYTLYYTPPILTHLSHPVPLYPSPLSKLRYISTELFGDFQYYLWGSFECYMSLLIYLFALWMRIYIHYLAQYLYLQVRDLSVAVTVYTTVYTIQYTLSYSISLYSVFLFYDYF